jgi:hypothetical protein
MVRRDYKMSKALIITAVWNMNSSRKILRSGLRQLGPDEEPEEVVGSCDVIRSLISDRKLRLM